MTAIIIIAVVVLLVVLWAVNTTNGFTKKEIRVQEGLSGVEVALTKRCDMLTKLLDTAKGYMTHEREMNDLSGRLFAVAENYPELRSSEVFAELQRGIRDAEEHLQAARRLYNTNVTAYNTAIAMFPAKLLAGSRQPKAFFEAEEPKRQDISINF